MERVEPSIMENVARVINNELMGNQGVTDFAHSIGLEKRDAVNNWLLGKSDIRLNSLIKISQVYNISVDYLLGLSDHSSPNVSIQGAQEITGLSREAIDALHRHKVNSDNMDSFTHSESFNFLNAINDLLCSDEGEKIIDSLVKLRLAPVAVSELLRNYQDNPGQNSPVLEYPNLRSWEVDTKSCILEAQEALSGYIQDYMKAREKLRALHLLKEEALDKGEGEENGEHSRAQR